MRAFTLLFFSSSKRFLVAGVVGAALREDIAGEYQVLPIRRKQDAARLRGKIGYLLRVRAVRIHHPDLGRSAAVRNEMRCAWNRATSAGARYPARPA